MRGHQRVPSGSREFKELTKRDAQIQLQHELDKLLSTVPDVRQPSVKKELDGFAQLFHRFLQEEGPSVDWERIDRLPENAVSHDGAVLSNDVKFQHKSALNTAHCKPLVLG